VCINKLVEKIAIFAGKDSHLRKIYAIWTLLFSSMANCYIYIYIYIPPFLASLFDRWKEGRRIAVWAPCVCLVQRLCFVDVRSWPLLVMVEEEGLGR
jgi:hypothetical protein